MSAELYESRLYWWHRAGFAKYKGKTVPLTAPPHLPDVRIDAIDYIPATPDFTCPLTRIMPTRCGWRDMYDYEIEQALAILRSFHAPTPQAR